MVDMKKKKQIISMSYLEKIILKKNLKIYMIKKLVQNPIKNYIKKLRLKISQILKESMTNKKKKKFY